MDSLNIAKTGILGLVGLIGGIIANLFGGFDMALQTLLLFMATDFITAWIVGGIFKNSPKTESGGLESRAGWKGLSRKGVTLLIVLVAAQLDRVTGTNFIRNAVVIGYIANEALSIVENSGLMGIPIPSVITKAIDILKKKSEDNKDGE